MQREVESGKYTALIDAQLREAREIGVTGLSTYVMDDRHAIVGEQPYETLVWALEHI